MLGCLGVGAVKPADVRFRIREIQRFAAIDDEAAHEREDALRAAVLRTISEMSAHAIAEDAEVVQALCRLAFSTRRIKFRRWCA